MRIDAHHHYWEPRRGDYHWMEAGDPILDRRYGPADLAPSLERHGIEATVVVQAAPSVEETEYLLGIADATESAAAVVGWVDFEDPGHRRHLERLARHPKLAAVRPMIQDLPDPDWMLRGDVQWAYRTLIDLDLAFDALGFPLHLDNFLTLFRRYPDLRAVIDHCMKPRIRDHPTDPAAFDEWAGGMSRLAAETSAFCKLSGLVTEAGEGWTAEDLRPFSDHVLSAFGPERVMWGSDWPVCRRRATYDAWREAADTLTWRLDAAGREAVFGGTAARFYRIGPQGPGKVKARKGRGGRSGQGGRIGGSHGAPPPIGPVTPAPPPRAGEYPTTRPAPAGRTRMRDDEVGIGLESPYRADGRTEEQAMTATATATAMPGAATPEGSTYVRPQEMDWRPTRFEGISIKVLYEDAEKGEMTCLLKWAPGASLPFHRHPEIEQSYVIEGSFYDHDGIARAGEYVWRRPDSCHETHSDEGCVILAVYRKPNVFRSSMGFGAGGP